MEFIQWKTQGLDEITHEPIGEVTHCAMFRFDEIDQTSAIFVFNPEVIKLALQETEELKEIGAISKDTKHISIRIMEDDEFIYRHKCVELFANLMGVDHARNSFM